MALLMTITDGLTFIGRDLLWRILAATVQWSLLLDSSVWLCLHLWCCRLEEKWICSMANREHQSCDSCIGFG